MQPPATPSFVHFVLFTLHVWFVKFPFLDVNQTLACLKAIIWLVLVSSLLQPLWETAGRHMFLVLSGALKGIDGLKAASK